MINLCIRCASNANPSNKRYHPLYNFENSLFWLGISCIEADIIILTEIHHRYLVIPGKRNFETKKLSPRQTFLVYKWPTAVPLRNPRVFTIICELFLCSRSSCRRFCDSGRWCRWWHYNWNWLCGGILTCVLWTRRCITWWSKWHWGDSWITRWRGVSRCVLLICRS